MSKPKKDDDGYPFDTGHWARWSNTKRLDWLRNFRDQLKKNDNDHARKFGLLDQLDQIDRDVAEMEKVVAMEEAAKLVQKTGSTSSLIGIDDSALRQTFASGDEAAVDREFRLWTDKLEAKAAKDRKFAKWFEDFRADQERLLRWDDVITGDDILGKKRKLM